MWKNIPNKKSYESTFVMKNMWKNFCNKNMEKYVIKLEESILVIEIYTW